MLSNLLNRDLWRQKTQESVSVRGSFHPQAKVEGQLSSSLGRSLFGELAMVGGPSSSSAAILVKTTTQRTHCKSSRQCEVLGRAADSGRQKGLRGSKAAFFLEAEESEGESPLPSSSSSRWSTWQSPAGTRPPSPRSPRRAAPSASLVRAVGRHKAGACWSSIQVASGGGGTLQTSTLYNSSGKRIIERKGPPTQELCAIWLSVRSFSGMPCEVTAQAPDLVFHSGVLE